MSNEKITIAAGKGRYRDKSVFAEQERLILNKYFRTAKK